MNGELPYDWRPGFILMLAEGRRSIDSQQRQLEGLRGRAGSLITYAGAIAGLFLALSSQRNWATILAIVAFAAAASCAGFILMPRRLHVDLDVQKIENWFEIAESNDHMIRSAGHAHWANYLVNAEHLGLLSRVYFAGICAIGGEMLLFAVGAVVS